MKGKKREESNGEGRTSTGRRKDTEKSNEGGRKSTNKRKDTEENQEKRSWGWAEPQR